jgi:competence protein ComEA
MKTRLTIRKLGGATALVAAALLLALAGQAPDARGAEVAGSGMSVNINTASAGELQTLPGVGEAKASAIVAYRKEHGAYRAPEDLLQVKGIGEALLQKIRPYVTLGGAKAAQ